jgi:hypothetical protein
MLWQGRQTGDCIGPGFVGTGIAPEIGRYRPYAGASWMTRRLGGVVTLPARCDNKKRSPAMTTTNSGHNQERPAKQGRGGGGRLSWRRPFSATAVVDGGCFVSALRVGGAGSRGGGRRRCCCRRGPDRRRGGCRGQCYPRWRLQVVRVQLLRKLRCLEDDRRAVVLRQRNVC